MKTRFGRSRLFLTAVVMLAAGLLLSACNKDEQGRITTYEKGKYLGKPDTALSPAQLSAIKNRHSVMASGVSAGGGSNTKAPNRRANTSSALVKGLDLDKLKARARSQSGGTGY